MVSRPRIFVTGATGQLGRLVIEALFARVPAAGIVAGARSPQKAGALAALGVEVRECDYARPETLDKALAGIDRLLLISSSEIGRRVAQHKAAIAAARTAGVKLIAYTSLLNADTSPLGLREEHLATEAALAASGIAHVLLRNGWYTENFNGTIAPGLEHGAVFGAAGDGRISAAARKDYAEAAAVVLAAPDGHAGKTYELAGDIAFTRAEWADALTRLAGRPVAYRNLPQADYAALLIKIGVPAPFAELLADSDAGAAKGGLFDDGGTLARLIGRPTTPLADVLAAAI